jgi:predicted negative regulator of RcsB-dependent stress response
MAYKKMIKKSETTLGGIVFSLILAIAIFFGFYLWMQANATEQGLTMPTQSSAAFAKLETSQSEIDTNINDVKDALGAVDEADSTFGAAWNGLKGLLAVAQLPLKFVSVAFNSLSALVSVVIPVLPPWANSLITMGITAFIVFVIWSIFKGDPNVIR